MEERTFGERLRNALDSLLDALDETERELSETERAAVITGLLPRMLEDSRVATGTLEVGKPDSTQTAEGIVKAAHATTFSDQALTLAWYSHHGKGASAFTSSDMVGMFRQCRRRLPKNMSDVLAKLENQSLLTAVGASEGGLKQYIISQDGDEIIEGRLKEDLEPPTE